MSGQRSDWRERLHANPSRMEQELAIKLQDNGIHYQTEVEIPVTTADFYFPLDSRSMLVFVDGRVHQGATQTAKDEELRSLLRKRGYRVLELSYDSYSDKKETSYTTQFWTPSEGGSNSDLASEPWDSVAGVCPRLLGVNQRLGDFSHDFSCITHLPSQRGSPHSLRYGYRFLHY